MKKSEQLNELYSRYREVYHDKEIVLGDGNIDARILLVGEAPGKDEVKLSKPFVGMAGRNLSEFLNALGMERDMIYITNAIKFRLSELNARTGRVVNRPAQKDEIIHNREYLLKEISILNPEYIVTLGNVPLKAVTGDYNASIGSVHGEIGLVTIGQSEYKLFPLYHPASIIYNQKLKEVYMNDINKLKELISP